MPHDAQFTASPLSRFHRSMPLEEWRVRRVDWRESLVTRSAAGTTLESRQMNRRSASAIARSPKKNRHRRALHSLVSGRDGQNRTLQIRAGGVQKDVTFAAADPNLNDEIDAAYRTKYRRYEATYVKPMVSPEARSSTIELLPR